MDRLHAHLCAIDSEGWRRAVDTLVAEIHPIDQNATRIWFTFYPLDLHLAIQTAGAEAVASRKGNRQAHQPTPPQPSPGPA